MPPAEPAQRGIIYVVSGGRSYLGELLASVDSLRKKEPDLPVTVFSRFAVPARRNLTWQPLESDEHPLKLKVLMLRRSPYVETLFLDTDTFIRGPVQPVFSELEGRDFCVANAHLADWSVRPPKFLAMVKPGEYNTGVLLYRRTPPAERFLQRWEEAVRAQDPADMWAGHNCDQHYFNLLVSAGLREECDMTFGDLDNVVWNCRGTMQEAVKTAGRWHEVRIFHHRTAGMKLRKLFYSATDPATAREIAGKVWRQISRPFRAEK